MAATGTSLPLDFTSREFKRDPAPLCRQLREQGPFVNAHIRILGQMRLATTYAAVNQILRDHESFVQEPEHAGLSASARLPVWIPRSVRLLSRNMIGMDEPDHRRLRGLVDQAFQKSSVEEMSSRISALAEHQLDHLEAVARTQGGQVDLMRDYARPFPLAVICELLGLPETDRPSFTRWASGLTTASSIVSFFLAMPGLNRLIRYVRQHLDEVRIQPRTGLISELVAARVDEDRLSEDELLAMVLLLLLAGHETTVHFISSSIVTLFHFPEKLSEFLVHPEIGQTAIEELMRYTSIAEVSKPRFAARDVEIGGERIFRGDRILPMITSANRDPEKFANPDELNLQRNPNPHLGFGTGIHVCLGARLARMENETALRSLFGRFPDLTLAVSRDDLPWLKKFGLRALKSLPAKLNT